MVSSVVSGSISQVSHTRRACSSSSPLWGTACKADADLGWWGGVNNYGGDNVGVNTSQVRVNTKGTLLVKLVELVEEVEELVLAVPGIKAANTRTTTPGGSGFRGNDASFERVGSIFIGGERRYAMRLWLDPDKLRGYNLSAADALEAVRAHNVQIAAGTIGAEPALAGQGSSENWGSKSYWYRSARR